MQQSCFIQLFFYFVQNHKNTGKIQTSKLMENQYYTNK